MSEVGLIQQSQQDHATGHKHACDVCSFSTSHLPALRTHVAVQHKEKDKLKPLACKVDCLFIQEHYHEVVAVIVYSSVSLHHTTHTVPIYKTVT